MRTCCGSRVGFLLEQKRTEKEVAIEAVMADDGASIGATRQNNSDQGASSG